MVSFWREEKCVTGITFEMSEICATFVKRFLDNEKRSLS